MSSFFSSVWHYLADREKADFIAGGRGIDRRARTFARSWSGHLARTRQYLIEALEGGADEVVVLGSGRLRDLPIEDLLERCNKIVLVDADPRLAEWSQRYSKRFRGRVAFELVEITGVLSKWTTVLTSRTHRTGSDLVARMRELEPSYREWSADTVVSLNILSQLGVMWRDRASRLIGEGLLYDGEVAEALAASIVRLEEAHIRSVVAARQSVIVADRFFITSRAAPFPWEMEDALYGPWPESVPNRIASLPRSWLWELVPLGGECRGEGIIHEVWGRVYR